MSTKRYYWLKLNEDFFEEDAIAWLEEQENGKEYSLFYLKLCLKSLKTNGILIRNVGQMLVPYDTKKLAEITRMDFDTVVVAMELLKKIGLVEVLESGEIYLTQMDLMVGSETSKAAIMRKTREKKALPAPENDDVTNNSNNFTDGGNNVTTELPESGNNVYPRVRDRDKEIDKEIEIRDRECERKREEPPDKPADSTTQKKKRFIKPSLEEIRAYCQNRQNGVDAERFFDYYESKGWRVGKSPMKDWKAAVRTWEKNNFDSGGVKNGKARDVPAACYEGLI